ncbi:MAG: putative toxin-antitoxin system toxin component, PIN family [Actinomycetota bacterium]
MRVVLDTNVYVSAALRPGGPTGQLVRLARAGRLQLVASPQLLAELWDVLRRPGLESRISSPDARAFVESIRDNSEIRDDVVDPPRVVRDASDDYLVALAVAGRVDALVTGDRDLTDLSNPPVVVLTPRQLLDQLSD